MVLEFRTESAMYTSSYPIFNHENFYSLKYSFLVPIEKTVGIRRNLFHRTVGPHLKSVIRTKIDISYTI